MKLNELNEQLLGTFQTEKGSVYKYFSDHTTSRFKAKRYGHDDFGQKEKSDKTIYVSHDVAPALTAAGLQNLGGKGARVILKGNLASLITWNKSQDKWGISPSAKNIPYSLLPGIDLSPIELWGRSNDIPGYEAYRLMHAGNRIVAMG